MPEDEETSLDLSKIKGWFKKKKTSSEKDFKKEEGKLGIEIDDQPEKAEKKENKEIGGVEVKKEDKIYVVEKEREKDGEEDEISFDLSKIKSGFKNIFKKEKKKDIFEEKSEEEISLDFKGMGNFFKRHAKWLIPVLLILIAMSFSAYFRTMPQRLPAVDEWAESTVYNFYRDQITSQINQQYPNLPDQNRNSLVENEFQSFLEQNKDQLKGQIAATAEQFKEQFKDDEGTLYLLGIDPWHFYRQVYYVLENGFPGSEIKDGQAWDAYRLAPTGVEGSWDFHTWFGAFLHKYLFFGSVPLMYSFFFVGAIFSVLAVIPAFFIGKRLTGNNVGAFFTAMLIAVTQFFVSRTTGESSDTDVYVVFFPLLITWLFLEAFETKNTKWRYGAISLAGIFTGVFAFAWSGWWYIFNFIWITLGIYLVYLLFIKNYKNIGKIKEIFKSKTLKNTLLFLVIYLALSGIFVSLIMGFSEFNRFYQGPLDFINRKAVAVNSLWPNIQTTVAEQNVAPFSQVISTLGGRLLLFLGILGIVLLFFKKDEEGHFDVKMSIFLIIWFAASLYATTKGVRFTLQAVPVFCIAFGAFAGLIYGYVKKYITNSLKIDERITSAVIFIFLALFLIQPVMAGYEQAYQSVPSMNDGWYDTLTKIKENSASDAILTSWWDFGYFFRAVADRPVTFDGGSQVGWGAHWVGKSLLTSDEKKTVGILRMLDCGQNNAFDELDKIFNDTPKEIDILNEIILEDKETAIKILGDYGLDSKEIASVIRYTHCEVPEAYYITSEDMVGKGGVWGHFGAWDFYKAEMWQRTHDLSMEKSLAILKESKYNLTDEQAEKYANEIEITAADQWISPWPSYVSSLNSCQKENNTAVCLIGTSQGTIRIDVNLKTMEAKIINNQNKEVYPNSIVYATKDSIEEKKFSGETLGASLILIPEGDSFKAILADPWQADGMFTKLFFFKGHGSSCFDLFDERRQVTGGLIYVWKVDWDCASKNKVFFNEEPKAEVTEKNEEVRASHILIKTDGRTSEEALEIIKEIESKVNETNFADLAKEYSECPSAAQGGDLGWFGKSVMVKEFEEAAFALDVGEVSRPVKTQFGWHLIKVIDWR